MTKLNPPTKDNGIPTAEVVEVSEFTTMYHPDINSGVVETTKVAFVEVWEEKGWVEGIPELTSPVAEVAIADLNDEEEGD